MTIDEAAKILARMYETAPKNDKVARLHLFGIQYANLIEGMPVLELVERAGLRKSYRTEVNKGIRLSRHVQLKT